MDISQLFINNLHNNSGGHLRKKRSLEERFAPSFRDALDSGQEADRRTIDCSASVLTRIFLLFDQRTSSLCCYVILRRMGFSVVWPAGVIFLQIVYVCGFILEG